MFSSTFYCIYVFYSERWLIFLSTGEMWSANLFYPEVFPFLPSLLFESCHWFRKQEPWRTAQHWTGENTSVQESSLGEWKGRNAYFHNKASDKRSSAQGKYLPAQIPSDRPKKYLGMWKCVIGSLLTKFQIKYCRPRGTESQTASWKLKRCSLGARRPKQRLPARANQQRGSDSLCITTSPNALSTKENRSDRKEREGVGRERGERKGKRAERRKGEGGRKKRKAERDRKGKEEERQGGIAKKEQRRKEGKEERQRTKEKEGKSRPASCRSSDGVNCSEEWERQKDSKRRRDSGSNKEAKPEGPKERPRDQEPEREGEERESKGRHMTHTPPANTLTDREREWRRKAATEKERKSDTCLDGSFYVLSSTQQVFSEHLPRCSAGDSSTTSGSSRGWLVTITGVCKCSMMVTPKREQTTLHSRHPLSHWARAKGYIISKYHIILRHKINWQNQWFKKKPKFKYT